MEEAVFLRELNKYKVVRREDQHKVLWNKRETGKLTAPAGSSAREAREPAAKKTAPPSAPSDFWAAMAEACQPKLKEAEVRQLLAAMRAVRAARASHVAHLTPCRSTGWYRPRCVWRILKWPRSCLLGNSERLPPR